MWQKTLQPWIEAGKVVAIGVVQEQHADRIRLYRQWRQLEWPIFIDALNVLDHRVVPIPMLIDEAGRIVKGGRFRVPDVEAFLEQPPAKEKLPKKPPEHAAKADDLFFAGKLDQAIAAYGKKKDDPRALFRLGVALRRRYESSGRQATDGQTAVDAWTRALELRPNQYIWRRRIQQYGPRLDKPYNMFGWVAEAREEIRARGEQPVTLRVEPRGTELIGRGPVATVQLTDPDPQGKIVRDKGLVTVESIVTPARVRPGHRVRVRLVFRTADAYWNNETEEMSLYVKPAVRADVAEGLFNHPNAKEAETKETRILEFELAVAGDAKAGEIPVDGYALYNVCEDKGGVCRYLRKDFRVTVRVDPKAPKIQ